MAGGGYSRQRKSSSSCFSIFNIFKSCCSSGDDDMMSDDGYYVSRICKSDEDGRTFSIAEPGRDPEELLFEFLEAKCVKVVDGEHLQNHCFAWDQCN
ncbi:hypothetical protein LWI29_031091 [Acer saccharum]|uniref:Uncharacterized protein n=1 Tax=Acer saccharum TaxID=4024 RepID=A0AA39TJ17_ACESA|nr:hypothetical protein LWI29_031091 [Acer saccharum]